MKTNTETIKEASEQVQNPKADWETVYVAPGSGKDKGTIFVGVNGKGYYVPRGKAVEVPPEVAEVLRNREKQLEQAEEYSDSVAGSE